MQRSILHDVCEVAGLAAYSFGEEDVDRHTVVWKKEAAPAEEELACLRAGRKWDPGEHARAKAAEEEERRDDDDDEGRGSLMTRESLKRLLQGCAKSPT